MARLVEYPFGENAHLDVSQLEKLVATAVRMMDNVIEVSQFPLEVQKLEALNKRRIGLGVTGLADALLMVGLRYGSDEAVEKTEEWMKLIARASYKASINLAKEKGAFSLFDPEKLIASGNMKQMDDDIKQIGRAHV